MKTPCYEMIGTMDLCNYWTTCAGRPMLVRWNFPMPLHAAERVYAENHGFRHEEVKARQKDLGSCYATMYIRRPVIK